MPLPSGGFSVGGGLFSTFVSTSGGQSSGPITQQINSYGGSTVSGGDTVHAGTPGFVLNFGSGRDPFEPGGGAFGFGSVGGGSVGGGSNPQGMPSVPGGTRTSPGFPQPPQPGGSAGTYLPDGTLVNIVGLPKGPFFSF